MRKIYFVVIIILFISNQSSSQAVYTWAGGSTGDYQVAANWTPVRTATAANDVLAFNSSSSAIAVTNVPNQTIGAIKILLGTNPVSFAANISGNILALSAAVPLDYSSSPGGSILTADFLTIALNNTVPFTLTSGSFGIAPGTGGKIIVNGALILSTGGIFNVDVTGTGGTVISSTGSITNTTGVFNCVNVSAITWQGGSNYYHACNGVAASAIPAASWNSNSTCNITGMNMGNVAPTGLANITFANFTWNCPSQISNVDLNLTAPLTIGGTFNLINTFNSYLLLAGASGVTVTAGAYSQIDGNLVLQTSSGTTTLSVSGNFSHTGLGTLDGVSGTLAGTAVLDLKKDVTFTGNAKWKLTSTNTNAQLNIQFSGSVPQTVTTTSGYWYAPAAGRCNIIITNSTGTGVNLAASSTLNVINTNSASAAYFSMAGVITPLAANSRVKYSGTGTGSLTLQYNGYIFQNATATEFPSSNGPANLIINDLLGVTFSSAMTSRSIPGTLFLVSGNLSLGNDTLLLTNKNLASQLTYSAGAGYITTGATGALGRYIPTVGLPTTTGSSIRFPLGSGVNDRSLNVFFSLPTLSTGGHDGIIYVGHVPVVGVSSLPMISDNGIMLDKRTDTKWRIATDTFTLGSGVETISLLATAANIGSVDTLIKLRLTDGVTGYGILNPNPNSGTTSVPVTGKSGLVMTDINKNIYIGSDGATAYNPLINITFTWTGASGIDGDWTRSGNWTGLYAVGYPSASTEIAIINTTSGFEPVINGSSNINVYQLTVGSGRLLTMLGNAGIKVFDVMNFSGTAAFSAGSTFGYASSGVSQTIGNLPYGNLSFSGNASKVLPSVITVKGTFSASGGSTDVLTNSNTFIYAGTGSQFITPSNYYNLTFTGNRAGGTITMGGFANNTIDIRNVFDVSTLSNFKVDSTGSTINFSSPGAQTIPGFVYGGISNTNTAPASYRRTLDPLGSIDPTHVVKVRTIDRGASSGAFTVTGSKVNLYVSGAKNATYDATYYNDLTYSGNLNNYTFNQTTSSNTQIYGKFEFLITNFVQGTNNFTYTFNGTGDQTIPGFKTISATTPAFKFSNVVIQGGSRNVTLARKDTIGINGTLSVSSAFAAGKGFIVDSSTVSFSTGSSPIPALKPLVAGGNNYFNIHINGGTYNLVDSTTIGNNVSVTGLGSLAGILNMGNGNDPRVINVLGNISINGSLSGASPTAQIDMNTGTNGSTKVNLAGNLSIGNYAQLMGTTTLGKSNGVIVFNGTTPQTYTNTSTFKNGLVNFIVGDNIKTTRLTLLNTLNLLSSDSVANRGTLTVTTNASLDCGTKNIITNGSGNAIFNLQSGATFITSNGGGVEGAATGTIDGTIYNGATAPFIVRTYNDTANYTFNGATNTPFSTGVPHRKLASLTINANVSLDKPAKLSNVFTLGNAVTFSLPDSDLTLRSTAGTTARVAQVPSTAAISYGNGRVNVERYYPAERSWRLATSPLSSNGTPTTIFNQWQNNGVYTPGIGTFVTGPGPNTATNGLDYSDQNNYSLKTYQNNAYVNIGNTLAPLSNPATSAANIGYFIFVRGDRSRSPDNTYTSNSNITTLSSRGKLQYGTQTFPGIARTVPGIDHLFILVGNPYASPISFDSITRNNIVKRFFVWDPKLNVVGGFITFDDLDNDGVYSQSVGSPGGQDKNIQSSQAFFVETDAAVASSSITFDETSKTTTNNLNMFRPVTPGTPTPAFKSSLLLVNADNSTTLADGNLVQFNDNFNNTVDLQDALKITNVNETFGLMRDGSPIAMERRKTITADDTLYLYLTRTTKRNYQFEFEPTNMDPSLAAFLEDSYTGTQTPVSITSPTTVNFTVNTDAKSSASTRFRIVFKNGATPLPVKYSSIKAYQKTNDIAVEWTVENEINIVKYDVEKSTDGASFTRVNTTIAKGANSSSVTYSFLDGKAIEGNNFYRIANYNQNGAVEYSRVVLVKIGKAVGTGISIYPNPVKGNTIGVAFNNMEKGLYNLKLINTLGQTMLTQQISHSTGNSIETITPGGQLSVGIYQLEVTAPDKHISTIKLIVQ